MILMLWPFTILICALYLIIFCILYYKRKIRKKDTKDKEYFDRYDSENALTVQEIKHKYTDEIITEEYDNLIEEDISENYYVARMDINLERNRYPDFCASEQTRVKLMVPRDDSDYINANYVDGFEKKRAYIATQGPLDHTCSDFWQMVLDHDVDIIVMLTKITERETDKCAKYFPGKNETLNFGNFRITNLNIPKLIDGLVFTGMELTNDTIKRSKLVSHILYDQWPDYGVPSKTSKLLKLLKSTNQLISDLKSRSPIVVHCSAGIGRTGTFIALDILTKLLASRGKVDIRHVVLEIRKQRTDSVMPEQYKYLFKTIMG